MPASWSDGQIIEWVNAHGCPWLNVNAVLMPVVRIAEIIHRYRGGERDLAA